MTDALRVFPLVNLDLVRQSTDKQKAVAKTWYWRIFLLPSLMQSSLPEFDVCHNVIKSSADEAERVD